jgi:plasmid stability protein
MAILNIRNLPDATHAKLRSRAAANGRSMEAEARTILTEAVGGQSPSLTPEDLRAFVDDMFGDAKPKNVVEDLLAERRREVRRERRREARRK